MPPNIVPGWPPQRGQRIDQGLFHTYSIGPAAGGPGGGPPGIGNPQRVDPQQQKMRIPPGAGGPGPGVEGGAPFGDMVAGMGAAVFNGLGAGTGAMLPGIGMGQGGFSAATTAPDPTPAGIRILNSGVWELTVPMGVPPMVFFQTGVNFGPVTPRGGPADMADGGGGSGGVTEQLVPLRGPLPPRARRAYRAIHEKGALIQSLEPPIPADADAIADALIRIGRLKQTLADTVRNRKRLDPDDPEIKKQLDLLDALSDVVGGQASEGAVSLERCKRLTLLLIDQHFGGRPVTEEVRHFLAESLARDVQAWLAKEEPELLLEEDAGLVIAKDILNR